MVRSGVSGFPVTRGSTKGTAAETCVPVVGAAIPAAFAAVWIRGELVPSGIGSTKAKHVSAMRVATVAQALTKERLMIP